MRWAETNWFKTLCLCVVGVFFSTSISPMAFGFAPPKPRQDSFVPSPVSLVTQPPPLTPRPSISNIPANNIFKNSNSTQVSKLLETAQQKLKELEVLTELKDFAKRPQEEAKSCAVPDSGPLVLQKDMPFTLSSSSNEKVGNENIASEALTSGEKSDPPQAVFSLQEQNLAREGGEESEKSWLEKMGNALGSLFVSEAYAQEPPAGPLDSTPDANTTDQFIIDKAAELTVGATTPQEKSSALFNFVRDEIGYESYRGSLRGARGTLWSMAGNALDQASLLIALLRVSGIPAQYAQGTITDPLAQDLILSMFPNPTRVAGCPPPDAPRADPANDPQLLTETREHYWVELDMGGGFIATG